ncbi:MAG: TM2 domain-containing protein [Actinomycetaceae bacterium]|nr:TM2 domain-containing protein [Actinomycetaceae bacterium]
MSQNDPYQQQFPQGQPAGYPQQDPYSQAAGYPQQSPYPVMPAGYSQKSAIVAGILGILLGGLGIHNFYLGRTGLGVAQLLITLLSLGILAVVSGVWGLVEGILYLIGSTPRWNTDARGIPLAR